MKNIEHIFFDLDRTLWDFETNSHLTLVELFHNLGLKEKLGIEVVSFIKEYRRINELFWADYRTGAATKEELRHGRFAKTFLHFGYENAPLATKIGELYITQSPKKTTLINGAIELLNYLRNKYELHIITNGFSEVQHIKMQSSGLSPFFKEIIISEKVGFQKPHINVFRFAEKAAESKPENSIMIGDHYDADIVGALNAGWKAIFFEPKEVAFENAKNLIRVRKLSEIKEWI